MQIGWKMLDRGLFQVESTSRLGCPILRRSHALMAVTAVTLRRLRREPDVLPRYPDGRRFASRSGSRGPKTRPTVGRFTPAIVMRAPTVRRRSWIVTSATHFEFIGKLDEFKPESKGGQPWIDLAEAARRLDYERKTLYGWIEKGILRAEHGLKKIRGRVACQLADTLGVR